MSGVGRFNVDGYIGWNELNDFVSASSTTEVHELTHSQVQTLLGAIGYAKGNDIWIPPSDRYTRDRTFIKNFPIHPALPARFKSVEPVLAEIDVVWMQRGGGDLVAMFEVEHTTTIYSGLLRFNDVHLEAPNLKTRFSIVSNDARRALYVRQVNRPTFRRSGLSDLCTFMEYGNVVDWHRRIIGDQT